MPIAVTVYEDENLFVSRSIGAVTLDDITAVSARIAESFTGVSAITGVSDFSGAVVSGISPTDIRDVAERRANLLRRSNARMRTILIATSDHAFGLARAYCAQAAFEGREEAAVVRCPIEAADWIGIAPERMADILQMSDAA